MTTNSSGVIDSPGIRRLIWTYFFLLMFEGVLRKWVLPGISDPLLLMRDPFLLLIYLLAINGGVFPVNGYITSLLILGILACAAGITVGSGNLLVTGYGFDSLFLHLPLIFVIPRVMTRDDVVKIGRWVLLLVFPMAILMVMQFRSPQDAWINCGAGGGVGAQIRGALGKIRPPGFFTFITGAAQFLALAVAFLIFGFWKKNTYPRFFLLGAGIAIAIAAAVSTSRLALGGIGLVIVMTGVVVAYDRKSVSNALGMLIPVGLILVVVTNLDVFHEGKQVFEARFEEAGDAGVGAAKTASNWAGRVFGDLYGGIHAMEMAPLFGAGLGVGTNVGARILSGALGFLLAEGEWARVILELGLILGPPYLLIRVMICGRLFFAAARSARTGNALPMLLFGSCGLLVLNGQFSQAYTLGFAVLGAGLCLAATNVPQESSDQVVVAKTKSLHVGRRGRSPYAAALHVRTESQAPK